MLTAVNNIIISKPELWPIAFIDNLLLVDKYRSKGAVRGLEYL